MRDAARLLTVGAVLVLSAATLWAAEREGFSVEVLVNGAARPEYASRGTLYIEALRGRNYQVRLHNPLPCRVAVALAVDGLNSIDAKHTTARAARKWVLEPYETVTIPGWQVSGSDARAFTFTGERGSYGAALGQTQNLGVIEAVFFREVPPSPPVTSRDDWGDGEDDSPRRGGLWPFGGSGAAEKRAAPEAAPSAQGRKAEAPPLSDAYAATGMGARRHHAVTQVHLELEEVPSATLRLRYEFRPVLVQMGVLPPPCGQPPLRRREESRGFEVGFCPEP